MLKKVLLATMLISCSMTFSAMAGTWQTGTGADQGKWWYDNGNGSYANNGWQWIDGNGDGTAECYYFDNAGWLLMKYCHTGWLYSKRRWGMGREWNHTDKRSSF